MLVDAIYLTSFNIKTENIHSCGTGKKLFASLYIRNVVNGVERYELSGTKDVKRVNGAANRVTLSAVSGNGGKDVYSKWV